MPIFKSLNCKATMQPGKVVTCIINYFIICTSNNKFTSQLMFWDHTAFTMPGTGFND